MLDTAPRITRHYRARRAQRALRPDVEAFVMTYGTERRALGATHVTVRREDLPLDLRDTEIAVRAAGWIVVAGDDGSLLTCYRRADAWRHIRRKSEPARRGSRRR